MANQKIFIPPGYSEPQNCTCGPNTWRRDFIPNHIFWLSIKDLCCIHDFMYIQGQTAGDKWKADRIFLDNMRARIYAKTKYAWLRKLRMKKAEKYYNAVVMFGGPFYWSGKTIPTMTRQDAQGITVQPNSAT